ncbi:MAG TPA: hypothetical protein VGI12_02820 [Vicinamibacterales bacterium]
MSRRVPLVLAIVAALALLAYLRDPPWLVNQASGLRQWEHPAGQPRYRWSTGHASFFVEAGAGAFDVPVSTTFDAPDSQPMLVSVDVDGQLAVRAVLTDPSWTRIHVVLPPPGGRRVRRIDLRTNVTRDTSYGVRVGALEFPPRLAAGFPR